MRWMWSEIASVLDWDVFSIALPPCYRNSWRVHLIFMSWYMPMISMNLVSLPFSIAIFIFFFLDCFLWIHSCEPCMYLSLSLVICWWKVSILAWKFSIILIVYRIQSLSASYRTYAWEVSVAKMYQFQVAYHISAWSLTIVAHGSENFMKHYR